ncbi:MAG TPA: M20/M25/M40 family metallo-hydrolase [Planctomycetes bacterium]|nr:M20/M25/M40 family metallo-hydrolase [Planctomycetota bacterium]
MATLDTLLDWIDLESITGNEGDYGDALVRQLESIGFAAEKQFVEGGRFNVLARAGDPAVVFCTHLDTVPPWFGPSREGGVVRGRGACDAKGPALAMIEAARRVVESGEERIGFLFTVGEETDGAGARFADEHRCAPWQPRFTIVGEPTENEFIRGGKGVYKCELHARGVAGHSSQPVGPSAIHELVSAIGAMLSDSWGEHPVFGEGTINFGEIRGGLAANVVAPEAVASVLVRAVEDPEIVEERLRSHLGENVELISGKGYGPIAFHVPEGREGPVVAFGTDAPFLRGWGTPLLYGPGSIRDAHTDHELVTVASFERAVADYEHAARELLDRIDAEGR